MSLRIVSVRPDGLADRLGIQSGDVLESIDGSPVLDSIDYQFLTAEAELQVELRRGGVLRQVSISKQPFAPLEIELDSDLMSSPKHCSNDCIFCFVSQLPDGLRASLYIKDDDWRLSLISGNYITFTNLPEGEIQRIIDRRASPLYLSVHATDDALRRRIMRNPNADRLLPLLRRLASAGISFHCQIVLCPSINDGEHLERTLEDLYALFPSVRSLALVPVGLTRHREGLTPLEPFTRDGSAAVLAMAERWRQRALAEKGSRFVFPADELYLTAGSPLPPYSAYEDFSQIENGVGLLRLFEHEFHASAHLAPAAKARARSVAIATGASAAEFLRTLIAAHPLHGVRATVYPIKNRFFGETVTASGLITGGDLIAQLSSCQADELLLPANMLRTGETVFLDGVSLSSVQTELRLPVRVVPNDGGEFFCALCGMEEA